jgi:hypothetical protein
MFVASHAFLAGISDCRMSQETQGSRRVTRIHLEITNMKFRRSHFSRALQSHSLLFPTRLALLAFIVFLASCTTTDYFGKTYPPTQRVDLFFNPQEIRRSYEVMGEIRAQSDELVSLQTVQQHLMKEAMQKGADAILVEHVGTTQTGFTTVENKTKDKKKSGKSSSTTVATTQIETNRIVVAKLLKYRRQ